MLPSTVYERMGLAVKQQSKQAAMPIPTSKTHYYTTVAHYTSFTRITTLQLRLQCTETPRLATQCPTVPLSIQPASITVTHSGRHMERAAPVSALPSDTTHDFDARALRFRAASWLGGSKPSYRAGSQYVYEPGTS